MEMGTCHSLVRPHLGTWGIRLAPSVCGEAAPLPRVTSADLSLPALSASAARCIAAHGIAVVRLFLVQSMWRHSNIARVVGDKDYSVCWGSLLRGASYTLTCLSVYFVGLSAVNNIALLYI